MIGVVAAVEAQLKDAQSKKEIYERLKPYIGAIVLVRHQKIERIGHLKKIVFDRDQDQPFYRIDSGDMMAINHNQHVEVLIDGAWKLLNRGAPVNEEL